MPPRTLLLTVVVSALVSITVLVIGRHWTRQATNIPELLPDQGRQKVLDLQEHVHSIQQTLQETVESLARLGNFQTALTGQMEEIQEIIERLVSVMEARTS